MKRLSSRLISILLVVVMLMPGVPMASVSKLIADAASLTIDFNYQNSTGINDAITALDRAGKNSRTFGTPASENEMNNSNSYWKHAYSWTVNTNDDGSLRKLLTSTNPKDKYIVLDCDDQHQYYKSALWETVNITTDKVLDLNGHTLNIRYNSNRKNNGYAQTTHEQYHRCVAFEISNKATLTIIDSSASRGEGGGKGTGTIRFHGYMVDPYKYDINYYTTRDLFNVTEGNLVIYGGTFIAGRQKDQLKSNFSWSKLKTVIGTAVELGVSISEYATGINLATGGLADVQDKVDKMMGGDVNNAALNEKGDTGEDDGTSGTPSTNKKDGADAPAEKKESTPSSDVDNEGEGRNQSVSEKKEQKNSDINNGQQGTKEGSNKTNDKQTAKDDKNTQLAKAQNEVVNSVVNKSKIGSMVDNAFNLVDGIVGLFGSSEKSRVTQSFMGTVVRVGNGCTFVSYGGTYKGHGSTPNTRNAVIEVVTHPGTQSAFDKTKAQGGLAYIYGGTFEGYTGSNIFNMVRANNNPQYAIQQVKNQNGTKNQPTTVTIPLEETGGVEVLYFENQSEMTAPDFDLENFTAIPIKTSNVQVRGGTFRTFYEMMNVAIKGTNNDQHFSKFPGTAGAVNLGVESYGEDLIRDGRIQIVDKYGDGALVLLDEKTEEENRDNGLYHYRLFCGDTELRNKRYLEVHPNSGQINSAYSMQLATYYGEGDNVSQLWVNDKNNERAALRQTEGYFDYIIDDRDADTYYVMPNFHDAQKDRTDFVSMVDYTKDLATSEIWYYNTPRDALGNPVKDISYSEYSITGTPKKGNAEQTTFSQHTDRESAFDDALHIDLNPYSIKFTRDDTLHYRTNLKWYSYKIYRVDPLTRENISESGVYGIDRPLIQVVYGDDDDSLKCKLPLKTVEAQIKTRLGASWAGFQTGEMYRIVLDIEEYLAYDYLGSRRFSTQFPVAKTESSILFRCVLKNEKLDTGSTQYFGNDFTPLHWDGTPKAGTTAQVTIKNGKAGMVDFAGDKIFDIYYQWWEVDKDGNEIRMIAGTDNIYTGDAGSAKALHRPSRWKVDTDGKTYVNTVDPADPNASKYTRNGLPQNPDDWESWMLHMYTHETLDSDELIDKTLCGDTGYDLAPENNNAYATGSDSCYIPADMQGKYIQVRVIAVNCKWTDFYDKKQTFKSHIMKVGYVTKPLSAEIGVTYENGQYATDTAPATVQIKSVKGLDPDERVSLVYYQVDNKSKTYNGQTWLGDSVYPKAKYPSTFYPDGVPMLTPGLRTVTMYIKTTKGREFMKTDAVKIRYEAQVQTYKANAPSLSYNVEDIRSGQLKNGTVKPFTPVPTNASVGFTYSKSTSTKPKVAKLDGSGGLCFGGDVGTTTITVKGADNKPVSVTVTVKSSIAEFNVSGFTAPEIGKALKTDGITVPANGGYKVKRVYWTERKSLFETVQLAANAQPENYHVYTQNVEIELNDGYYKTSGTPYVLTATLADGASDIVNGIADYSKTEFDWINNKTFVARYTFNSITGGAASVIDKIYLEYPTEVSEGDDVETWLARVRIGTNGDDSQVHVDEAQLFTGIWATPVLASVADYHVNALAADPATSGLKTFMKGVQTGFQVMLSIDNNVAANFAEGTDAITVYVNGAPVDKATRITGKGVWAIVNDTIKVADGARTDPMPVYSLRGFDLRVNQTVNVDDLLNCADPRVTLTFKGFTGEGLTNPSTYLSYDADANTLKPLKTWTDNVTLTFEVAFDSNGDGFADLVKTAKVTKPLQAASAAAGSYPQKTFTVKAMAPDDEIAYNQTFTVPYTWGVDGTLSIPEIPDAFICSVTSTDGSKTFAYKYGANRIPMNAASGSLLVKTVYADEFEVHPGATKVYGFQKDYDGNIIDGFFISIDGDRFYQTDHIDDLEPNTLYTLYYKQGIDGTVYQKVFRTASTEYGVYIGRMPVTDGNLGNLERDGWHYDPDTRVLTLRNFNMKDPGTDMLGPLLSSIINSEGSLIVELQGDENYLESTQSLVYGINARNDLTIQGNGSLTIQGKAGSTYNCGGVGAVTGDLYLKGTGKLTFIDLRSGVLAWTGSKHIYYVNGELDFQSNDKNDGCITLPSGADRLVFDNAYHSYTITTSNGNITPDELRTYIKTEWTSDWKLIKNKWVHIVPAHNDVKRVQSPEYLKSGACGKTLVYNYACECGHIGKTTYNVSNVSQHAMVDYAASPATCVLEGWDAYSTCSRCGYTTFEASAPLGHDWEHHDEVLPTCTEDGSPAWDVCKRCGLSTKVEPADMNDAEAAAWGALGHSLKSVPEAAATCESAGVAAHYACMTCGTLYADAAAHALVTQAALVEPELSHAFTREIVSEATYESGATCISGEHYYYTCAHCDEISDEMTFETGDPDPAAHRWGEWYENGEGKTVHDCALCGATEEKGGAILYGDVDGNGEITPGDARLALRISLGLMKDGDMVMTDEMQARADVDGKDGVQPGDARLILRKSLGLVDPEWRTD